MSDQLELEEFWAWREESLEERIFEHGLQRWVSNQTRLERMIQEKEITPVKL